ncbi:MAG: hypothetical protein K1X88_10400 [Nannocystaceae bacterium]|nr:hypothetical protein [Nannocystaceae bacterium]
MNQTSAMPMTLKILLGLFAAGLCFDAYLLSAMGGGTGVWLRVALTLGAMIGLLRGSESVRALLRAIAVIGFALAAFSLVRMIPVMQISPSLAMVGVVAGAIMLVHAGFMFWTLGREDVELWMARRSFGDA